MKIRLCSILFLFLCKTSLVNAAALPDLSDKQIELLAGIEKLGRHQLSFVEPNFSLGEHEDAPAALVLVGLDSGHIEKDEAELRKLHGSFDKSHLLQSNLKTSDLRLFRGATRFGPLQWEWPRGSKCASFFSYAVPSVLLASSLSSGLCAFLAPSSLSMMINTATSAAGLYFSHHYYVKARQVANDCKLIDEVQDMRLVLDLLTRVLKPKKNNSVNLVIGRKELVDVLQHLLRDRGVYTKEGMSFQSAANSRKAQETAREAYEAQFKKLEGSALRSIVRVKAVVSCDDLLARFSSGSDGSTIRENTASASASEVGAIVADDSEAREEAIQLEWQKNQMRNERQAMRAMQAKTKTKNKRNLQRY